MLNDALLVPIGPVNHTKDLNIRTHVFLCILGMLFYRYLAWRCRKLNMGLKGVVGELEGIRIALAGDNDTRKCRLIVEDMNVKQARLFSLLDMGRFIGD